MPHQLIGDEPNPRFVAVAGPLRGSEFKLSSRNCSVGRDLVNDIVTSDIASSRHHCRVEKVADGWRLVDLQSDHGTFVNGIPVDEWLLNQGDEVAIGSSIFSFLIDPKSEPPARSRLDFSSESQNTAQKYLEESHRSTPDRELLTVLLQAGALLPGATNVEEFTHELLWLILRLLDADRACLVSETFETSAMVTAKGQTAVKVEASRALVRRAQTSNSMVTDTDSGASTLCFPLLPSRHGKPCFVYVTADRSPILNDARLRALAVLVGLGAPILEDLWQRQRPNHQRQELRQQDIESPLVGSSEVMNDVLKTLAKAARADSTILLLGETGSGKELAARSIHRQSSRANQQFITVDCATLTEGLAESLLFGHEKGSFTGATRRLKGKFEIANGGTIFLDEIAELSPSSQARLLRVLQERQLTRIGAQNSIDVDIRLITATNVDIATAVQEGRFRQDLYYRIAVIEIRMPALRDRRSDIRELADHLLAVHSWRAQRGPFAFTQDAYCTLENHDWPGNVRELSNAIERAVVLAESEWIDSCDFEEIHHRPPPFEVSNSRYKKAIVETKRSLVESAMKKSNDNVALAAKDLGLNPTYLHRLLHKLKLR